MICAVVILSAALVACLAGLLRGEIAMPEFSVNETAGFPTRRT